MVLPWSSSSEAPERCASAKSLLNFSGVDLHNRFQEFQGVLFGSLEGIAADNRPEAAAIADGARFVEDGIVPEGATLKV